eukprot:4443683-Pleurochrysis_carterae.AAC.1
MSRKIRRRVASVRTGHHGCRTATRESGGGRAGTARRQSAGVGFGRRGAGAGGNRRRRRTEDDKVRIQRKCEGGGKVEGIREGSEGSVRCGA